jgi:hypothetical protein
MSGEGRQDKVVSVKHSGLMLQSRARLRDSYAVSKGWVLCLARDIFPDKRMPLEHGDVALAEPVVKGRGGRRKAPRRLSGVLFVAVSKCLPILTKHPMPSGRSETGSS